MAVIFLVLRGCHRWDVKLNLPNRMAKHRAFNPEK